MKTPQEAAIAHFIDADIGRLSTLVWECWQLSGKVTVEPWHSKPLPWERRPLIDSWYASLTMHAAALGIDNAEIDRRLSVLLERPFSIKEFRKV